MKYDKAYFLTKFAAIPEKLIGEGSLQNCCALYHCGVTDNTEDNYHPWTTTEEALALADLFRPLVEASSNDITGPLHPVWRINDANASIINYRDAYKALSPKQRILAALNSLPDPTP